MPDRPYTIVVAFDGDPGHRAVVDWAVARAIRDHADVHLVHVVQRFWGDPREEPAPAEAQAISALLAAQRAAVLRELAAAGQNALAVTATMRTGHVVRELAAVVRSGDLLVVGSPARDGRPRSFTGAVAVRAAASAVSDVAAIPHDWRGGGAGVVVGVDGEAADAWTVAFAAAEAVSWGEMLTVVCAGYRANPLLAGLVPEVTVGDRRDHIIQDRARAARDAQPGITVCTNLVEAAPAPGLLLAAHDARMLVVGTPAHRGFSGVMLGSVAHDVLLNAGVPVVVVRGPSSTVAIAR